MKPAHRPKDPRFGSGPTRKRPGWSLAALDGALTGRSHRASEAMARLADVIARSREVLRIPQDYHVAILPASDTGAFEAAMWSLLGARGVDVLAWESFGRGWVSDIRDQLRIEDLRVHEAGYGDLPDLAAVDCDRDVVFTWNGTTSGVRVPNGDWIASDREGLTLCDATSAVFAMHLPWDRLDAVTWSWQKVLGGEAQHGMIALGPRAVQRLESHTPAWPLPKIFRMTKGGSLIEGLFRGATINTPSMLAVEDVLDALQWAGSIGGLDALVARSEGNLHLVAGWIENSDWVDFLASDPATRSSTSICLRIVDPEVRALSPADQRGFVRRMTDLLAAERIAYDIGSYRDAPPGLRIWGGATVERHDIAALLPWLEWAFCEVRAAGH